MTRLLHRLLQAGLLGLVCLLPFDATGLSPVGSASSPEALGTVKYDVRYKRGKLDARVATATISWEESAWQGTPALHSAAVIRTTPLFKLFLGSDYFAEACFDRKDLSPLYFINPFKSGGKDGKYEFNQITGLKDSYGK